MNSFPYRAFGQDFTDGDVVNVKADERVPPLFMLPPMYNGYTSYTCPILEDKPALLHILVCSHEECTLQMSTKELVMVNIRRN